MSSYHPFILHCGSPLNPLFAEVVLLTELSKNVTWGNFYAIHLTKCPICYIYMYALHA
jgi:hypothetical protein